KTGSATVPARVSSCRNTGPTGVFFLTRIMMPRQIQGSSRHSRDFWKKESMPSSQMLASRSGEMKRDYGPGTNGVKKLRRSCERAMCCSFYLRRVGLNLNTVAKNIPFLNKLNRDARWANTLPQFLRAKLKNKKSISLTNKRRFMSDSNL